MLLFITPLVSDFFASEMLRDFLCIPSETVETLEKNRRYLEAISGEY